MLLWVASVTVPGPALMRDGVPPPVCGPRRGRCCQLEGVRGGRAFCAGSGQRVVDASTLDAGCVAVAGGQGRW